jgi:hypothetical protein
MKNFLNIVGLMLISSGLIAQLQGPGDITEEIQLNTITTAVPFLQIAPDSRSSGVGDAGLGLLPDANQLHWNPSSLAFGEDKLQISLSYSPWLRDLVADMNLAYLAVYGKLNDKQAIGGSLTYFSLGDIQFTDNNGAELLSFSPNEFAIDFTFAQKFGKTTSGAVSARYISSNLTGGLSVGAGTETQVGRSFAVDLSFSYINKKSHLGDKDLDINAGFNISNIGSKMSYTANESAEKDFIPTNLRIGSGFNLHLDDYNELSWELNFNKLLVPTPPIYADTNGTPIFDSEGNPIIAAGMDPNVGPIQGMIQSFYDAPGGFKEEMQEITIGTGFEYWYARQLAVRVGYFYENPNKGNRQFITLGVGVRYNIFSLDFSYLIATTQRNPLANTLRFTLLFSWESFGKNKNNKNDDDPSNY